MPVGRGGRLGWWSPEPRGVLPLDGVRVSRSLRRSLRRFEVRVDTAFDEVVRACADPSRPGGWIDAEIIAAYRRLHDLRWVHSVEAWTPEGTLAGGLYGVAIGGLFAGESMFHTRTDASKVALVGLVERLVAAGVGLFDVQWLTPHLASLGAVAIPRRTYLERLTQALSVPITTVVGAWPAGTERAAPLPQTVPSPPESADITTLRSECGGGATPTARPTMG